MGYVHGWHFLAPFTDEEWVKIINAFCDLVQHAAQDGLSVCLSDVDDCVSMADIVNERSRLLQDHSKALRVSVLNDYGVPFMLGKEGNVYWSPFGEPEQYAYIKLFRGNSYDELVVAMLCYLASFFPDNISVSSDGRRPDWYKGLLLAQQVFGPDVAMPSGIRSE